MGNGCRTDVDVFSDLGLGESIRRGFNDWMSGIQDPSKENFVVRYLYHFLFNGIFQGKVGRDRS